MLWDRPAPIRVLVRIGGRLVVHGHGTMESWDVRTGEVLWSTPLESGEDPALSTPLTDGVRVAVPGSADGALHLTVFRVADGDRLWRSGLPAGAERVIVLGDRLAAIGRLGADSFESVVVLG
ncbi:PQQ-binding-like beta-propeller repeat protein [Cellulomonas sp. ATA003]|uniref:outer membrane protein assembly factor BamB family protein n=1 Tax=Cellulomonas sp. ATA003 TaxID=3073064 RepID=UPI0037BF3B75